MSVGRTSGRHRLAQNGEWMRRFKYFCFMFVLGTPSSLGCESANADGRAPACSTGDPYPPFTPFPSVEVASHPKCTPRCAYKGARPVPGTDAYNVDALPSGACDVEGYVCSMTVFDFCTTKVNRCECTAGTWSCGVMVPGSGGCGTACEVQADGTQTCRPQTDAGLDAASEAAP